MYLGHIFHKFCLEICRVSQVMYTALRVFVVDCKVATDIQELQTVCTHRKYLSVEFECHQKLQWQRKSSCYRAGKIKRINPSKRVKDQLISE